MKANLWWLSGYPDERAWHVVRLDGGHCPADEIALDGALLRKATYTANTLRRDFPRALPQLVGDAPAWREHLDTMLALLKTRVHGRARLPADLFEASDIYDSPVRARASALRASSPALVPWVHALSWTLATTPKRAAHYLRAAEEHADALVRLLSERPGRDSVVAGVQLVHLATAMPARLIAPLAALVRHPAPYQVPLRGAAFATTASRALDVPKTGARPMPTRDGGRLHRETRGWIAWLIGKDAPTRRRFLRTLGLCGLEPLLGDWFTWWQTADLYLDRARRLAKKNLPVRELRERFAALREGFDNHRNALPPEVDAVTVGRVVRQVAEADFPVPAATVRRALENLPNERSAMRLGLLAHWVRLLEWASPHQRNGVAVIAPRFAAYLSRTADEPRALTPWREALVRSLTNDNGGWAIDGSLSEQSSPVIKRVFDAIERIAHEHPALLTTALATRVVQIAEVVRNPGRIADIALRYAEADPPLEYVRGDVLRAALASCGDDLTPLPGLIRTFTHVDDETNLGAGGLRTALVPLFRHHRALVNDILVGPHSAEVLRCARRLAAVVATGHPPPRPRQPKQATAWIRDYPPGLRDALAQLASTSEDAEDIARKLLRSAWRPAPELHAERAALRARIDGADRDARAKLERRLAGLDDRIAHPKPLSPAKTAKLADKVRRRAGLALLEGLSERAAAVLARSAAALLEADAAPEWITSDRAMPLLAAILELPKASRTLGLRVLRERCGPPPWDLRNAPKNRAFLTRMSERNIDCGPWIDGVPPVTVRTGRGPVTLAFEDDPLEALHMGGHFQTCLSPGAFNFFSAVSNCADINKRVLYGRSQDGAVVARRLLCLTNTGKVLAFNAYCHDGDFDFEAASTLVANDLARAMNTTTASSGHVPCTLAPDWYDDGPEDITGAHALVAEGSDFRAALAEVEPVDLPALIARETGATTLDPFVAPVVIALPEIERRPALAIPLCSLVGPLDALELAPLYILALRITNAGAESLARERLVPLLYEGIARSQRTQQSYSFQHVDLLCKLDAVRGLRILKLTRSRGMRTWADEEYTWRLSCVASCLERLSRPVQARRTYELAARAHGTDGDRKHARDRAAALAR